MEVFGNIQSLKEAIKNKYASKIKELEKEKETQLAEIEKELRSKLDILSSKMKVETDSEVKKAHSMILSEDKLKAKKEFEEKREELIEAVFKEADKKARKVAHTKEYIDYVKANLPKEANLQIVGDGAYYKKHFPKCKTDKNIVGLKFESSALVYDFTLNNIIASKKDILRQKVSKALFS